MSLLTDLIVRTLQTAGPATAATSAAVAACGAYRGRKSRRAHQRVSHIAWGDEAAEQEDASLKYTASGAGQ